MRILLVSQMYPGPDDPDLGVFVRQLELALRERGHEIELAVLDRRAGGKKRFLELRRKVRAATRPDVVWAHFLVPSGAIAASVDARRFRSLFELGGCGAHDEDTWEGRRLRLGAALVEIGDPVIRCAVTTRDPDTGEPDLDTLRLIASYRGQGPDGEIWFARYGRVVEPGRVRVGDAAMLV